MDIALALALVVVAVLVLRAIKLSREATEAAEEFSQFVAVDPVRPIGGLPGVPQRNMTSSRYGIFGRPDRIIPTAEGLVPIDVKHSACPASGPRNRHLAQVAVYCLLFEGSSSDAR